METEAESSFKLTIKIYRGFILVGSLCNHNRKFNASFLLEYGHRQQIHKSIQAKRLGASSYSCALNIICLYSLFLSIAVHSFVYEFHHIALDALLEP